jgi:hypothetical protein
VAGHINVRLQPRRLMISPAVVGCKPMFGGGQAASHGQRTSALISNRTFWTVWGIEITV